MSNPKISVLMAVYNTNEKYLREALDSILVQTFSDFELLIVDDASPDRNVEKVIKSYNDIRIKYHLNEKNMGISETRNKLMELAKGEYFAVMDHDDLILPDKFKKQVEYMDAHPNVGLCGTGYKRFGKILKNKVIRHPTENERIKAFLFFKCVMHHPSIMIRGNVIKEHNICYNNDYISANDQKLYLDIAEVTELHNLPDVLSLYRLHNTMTSVTQREKISKEQQRLRDILFKKIGVNLSDDEVKTVNNFVMKGRCRIKDVESLNKIEEVLVKFVKANEKSKAFPEPEFSEICAKYLIKRCLNAAIYSFINSGKLLKNTKLPVLKIKQPITLKILNKITLKGR